MPTALRGGTATSWRCWGKGAPRVLMLHCSLAHSGAWEGLASRLRLSCVAFDAPGHGRSGPLNPAMDYQVQCLRVAEDFVAKRRMDVLGHSFGATVALRLTAEPPDSVRRLVLVEPLLFAAARGTDAFEAHGAAIRPYVEALEAGDARLAAQRFTAMWGTGVNWSDMRKAHRDALAAQIRVIPAQNGALFEDNARMLAAGRLEAIAAPTLLLAGAVSPAIVHAIQDVLEARMPQTQRVVIAGAGHMAPITHPGPVANAVRGFLGP